MSDLPHPPNEVNSMLKELANFVVSRQPMSGDSKELLDASLTDQQNQIKLIFAAVASSKVSRLSRLAGAVDILQESLTSPENLKKLKHDPAEQRRHLELLREIEAGDLEFLRTLTDSKAEDRGFSSDPRQQFNLFFGANSSENSLASGIDTDSRRNLVGMVEKLFSLVTNDGEAPKPPEENRALKSPRTIDVVEEKEE